MNRDSYNTGNNGSTKRYVAVSANNKYYKRRENCHRPCSATEEKIGYIQSKIVLTAAIVDRLAHKSHIIDLTGESFRAKETIDWLSNN